MMFGSAMKTRDSRYMGDNVVMQLLGIRRTKFYRLLQEGSITPPAGRLAKNRRGWTLADVELAKQEIQEIEKRNHAETRSV
jgi:predicted DNA-binding transcriptional regulator AlpA